ncbi:MAG: M48 family metallopeptidase [Gammaproteobacteria bacterium]|nr:M48 family metallopeptidase [Gammaproteobacteria bacterium]
MSGDARKAEFKTHVRRWAAKLSVNVASIYVRPMRSKWASCSSNGVLSFNAELLEFEPTVWDYIIVHELLHFNVPNHGKLWKSLMRAHVGDWEASEALLRRHESLGEAPRSTAGENGRRPTSVERK